MDATLDAGAGDRVPDEVSVNAILDRGSLIDFALRTLPPEPPRKKRYAEIGVRRTADLFDRISADEKIGIDPDPTSGATHVMTSDAFFAQLGEGETFDVIFIDGDHHHDQVYRDAQNALAHLADGGIVMMHDCMPAQRGMEDPSFCGTAWRAFAKLRELIYVDAVCCDFDHGVGILKKRRNPRPVAVGDMDALTYDDFLAHREDWMRACTVEQALEFIASGLAGSPATAVDRAPLALCVVAKDGDELASFLAVHGGEIAKNVDELVAVDNRGGRFGGLAAIGNRALAATRSTAFGLIHADTGFRPGALAIFRDAAIHGKVAGIVGRPIDGRYLWAFGGGGDDVTCLDGCAVFFRRDLGLSFDEETFDGFHCVGEDLSLLARSRGIPIVVPNAQADHRSSSNFPDAGQPGADRGAWLTDYHRYVEKLRAKWSSLEFLTS